jgi:hypothetical protein
MTVVCRRLDDYERFQSTGVLWRQEEYKGFQMTGVWQKRSTRGFR